MNSNTDPTAAAIRTLTGSAGALLLLSAYRRGGITGALVGLAGAALCVHAVTGKSPLELLPDLPPPTPHPNTPSFPDAGIPAKQEPIDAVEESSMESFPASDPPGSYRASSAPVSAL